MHDEGPDAARNAGVLTRVLRGAPAVWTLLLFYAAYVGAGTLCNGLSLIPGVAIIFWPPAGILIATLLLSPRSSWPWWIAAGCAAELTCNALLWNNPLQYAFIYYAGNALEALTAAWLIGRFAPKPFRFETIEQVLAFLAFGAGIAPIVSATVIATVDAFRGKHLFTTAWPLVWLGDATGMLVSAPITFVAVQTWRERANIPLARFLEAGSVLGLMAVIAVLSLSGSLPTIYLTLPLLLWIAVRFGLKGAAAALGVLAFTTGTYTAAGFGQFAAQTGDPYFNLIRFNVFLGVSAISALFVAALSQQRKITLAALEAANRELEDRFAEQTGHLLENRKRLDLATQRAGVGTWETDLGTGRNIWSAETIALIGAEGSELDSDDWLGAVHAADRAAVAEAWRRAIEEGAPYEVEFRGLKPAADGGPRWLLSRGSVERDAAGRPIRGAGVLIDITERKHLEAKSREQFEELESIYASVPVGLAVIDKDLRFVRVNDWLAKMNGSSPADHVGRPVSEIVPALAEQARAVLQKVIETGEPVRDVIIEGETAAQPSVQRAWQELWSPVKDDRGEVIAVSVVVEDVTESRWAENLISEQNRLFEMIAAGRPLEKVLTELTAVIDRLEPSTRSAVLMADRERCEFEAAYAANIPDTYVFPLRGVRIEETPAGTCCAAVYRGEPISSTDVASDMRWTDVWRELCLNHGIRACHSEPIFGEDGRPIGTVVLGFDTPREPDERGLRLVRLGAQVAGVAIERARAEENLRASEREYRTLFESIDEGYCVVEVICDEQERPVDYRFIQINPAFAAHTGLPVDSVGRTARELVPDLEDRWVEVYGSVALTGEPVRFENRAEPMDGRWFDVYALRVGEPTQRRVGILFNDITERRARERALAAAASRDEFRVRLTDNIRGLKEADAVKIAAANVLGEWLGVNRATYAEVRGNDWIVSKGYEQGVRPMRSGRYSANDFGKWIMDTHRAGETVVFNDSRTDPRFSAAESDAHAALDIIGGAGVPLIKAGELVAILTVHSAEPREWTEDEIAILEETAQRTWDAAERVRAEAALRLSEERLRLATAAAGIYTWEYDPSTGISYYSPNMRSVLGFELPENTGNANLYIHPHDRERVMGDFAAFIDGQTVRSEYRYVDPRTGKTAWVATHGMLIPTNGRPARAVGITQNITERKLAEERVRAGERENLEILESITDAFFGLDSEWRFSYTNRQAELVLGREPGSLIGKVIWDVYPGLVGSKFETAYRAAMDEGKTSTLTDYYPDHERWYEVHVYPRRSADGVRGVSIYFQNATERIMAEEALRKSESTFRQLVEASPFGIYVVDADFKLTSVSAGAQKVFENVRPLIGRDFAEVLRVVWEEPFATEAIEIFRHTLETGEAYHAPRTVETRDDIGEIESYDWKVERIAMPDGRYGVVCHFYDLSERLRHEAAIRASEDKYRVLFDSMDEGYCIIEMIFDEKGRAVDYRFVEVNSAFERQAGMQDVVGRRMLEFVPSIESHWLENYSSVARTGIPVRFANEYKGLGKWFDVYAFRPEGWDEPYIAVLFTDITERKLAEAALSESERRFRNMADNAPVMIWVTEPDGYCTYLSQSWYDFTGQTPEEGLGYGWLRATHPDDAKMAEEVFRSANDRCEPFRVEYRLRNKEGKYRWAIDSAQPRFSESGVYLGYIGSVIDIHERKEAEEQSRRNRERFDIVRDGAEVGFWFCDLPFAEFIWDNRVKEHFWLPPDARVTVDTFYERIHPDDRERTREAIADSNANRTQYDIEYRTVEPNGDGVKWIRAIGRTFYDKKGEPVRFDGVTLDVTDSKLVEQALRESEERYRTLFETIDEGFCVIELLDGPHGPLSDYVHLEANPAFEENTGIPDIAGIRLRELAPDEADGWVEIYRKVLITGKPVRFERELAATGRRLELAAFRVEPAERRQVAVLFKDVTTARRAEEELRKQTELLRAITESTPDLIFAKDASGRLIMANKATLDVIGQTEETAIGRLDSDLYDALEADLIMANDRRVMQSGRTETIEEVVTTAGDTRTYLTTKNPLHDPQGRVIGLVGISHDITALKRAEMALRDSEMRHRLALESGNMGTWTMPLDGRPSWADERTLALFDIPVEEWTGDASLIRARRLPEDQEVVNQTLAKAIAERSTWRAEFRVRRRDGSIRWIAGVGRIEFDQRGEPVLMRGINFDITERKQAEEELRSYHEVLEATVRDRTSELAAANRELKKENTQRRLVEVERQRLLRQLVAAQEQERRRIAQDLHDHLGQQLTALNLKLELALQSAADGDAAGHLHEAKAMMRQIDDDVDALAWQLRPAILDDDGFLPALRKYIEDWSRRCGIHAELWTDGHFENHNGLSAEAETNLYRITQEALNNVAKYARAGRVEVLLTRRGDSAVLTVQDDGAGFDEAAAAARAEKSMGLIGMRERAGLVGGTFQVESSPGGGTAIYVRVPFAETGGVGGSTPAAGS